MELLNLAASISNLVALVAFIWLIVIACKKGGALWGVLVALLSPITAIIFATKYWTEARKPFLVYIVSITISFAYLGYMYQQLGISEVFAMQEKMESGEFTDQDAFDFMEGTMHRMENSGLLDEQEQQDLRQMKEIYNTIKQGGEFPRQNLGAQVVREPSEVEPGNLGPAKKVTSRTPYPRPVFAYQDISIRQLGAFVNKPLKVLDYKGREHQVTLLGIESGRLMLRKSISSGNFDYGIRNTDVDRIQALMPTVASN